jgi:hypothetical protein
MGINKNRKREWSEEEMEWLKENYPYMTDYKLRTHLHMSQERLIKLAKEFGWQKVNHPANVGLFTPKKKTKKVLHQEEDSQGYCMDCSFYRPGGLCKKTGKDVGALWMKKCFRGEA